MIVTVLYLIYYLLLTLLVYYAARYVWELIPVSDLASKTVFISGCDTGFGRILALKCAKDGITVFAGCYSKNSEESLIAESKDLPGKVIPIPLDITSDESVKNAAKLVKSKLQSGQTLWALVNNAGIFTCYGPDAWTSIEEYKFSLDVNAFGHVRCVHAFLPLLKQSKGRIITVTSVAGRVSVPCGAPYAMAKYASEAYMDAIRQELKPYGITCCILEPQAFKTNLIDNDSMRKRVDQVWDKLDADVKEAYGQNFKENFVNKWNEALHEMASPHLHYVVDNYYHAITARFPRYRYRCGWASLLVFIPLGYLPTGLEDYLFALAIGKTALPAELENGTLYKKEKAQ
uniref:17-beta-hydroxysteroid dehydrogenase type 6 n=1 Tax=Panagrellus redivivus TaxID=6233 RepID=A0A7E5A1C2_PANRE